MHRKQSQPFKMRTEAARALRGLTPTIRLASPAPQEPNERISGHLGSQEDRLRILTPRASCAPQD